MRLKPETEGAGGVDLSGSVNVVVGKAAGATLGDTDNGNSSRKASIVTRTAPAVMRRRITTPSAEMIVLPFTLPMGRRSGRPDSKTHEGQDRHFVAKWALAFQWARAILVQPHLLGLQIPPCVSDNFS